MNAPPTALSTPAVPLAPSGLPDRGASARRRPAMSLLVSEPVRATMEAIQALGRWRHAPPQVGRGHTVLLFPGLGTDGRTLWPLRRHLGRAGFRALDWGQGVNIGPQGDVDAWIGRLAEAMAERAGPVPTLSLVGWSLGGFYARELAKRWPDRVRQVITVGTPFNGCVDDTHVAWLFRLLNGRLPPDEAELRERLAEPPPVPTCSIYSRSDGFVGWKACTHGQRWPQARDVEVSASHIGMSWAPDVLDRMTELLAQHTDPAA